MMRKLPTGALLCVALTACSDPVGPPPSPPPPQKIISVSSPLEGMRIVQTGWPNTPVSFSASVSGTQERGLWSINGNLIGDDRTVELQVGSYQACYVLGELKKCVTFEIVPAPAWRFKVSISDMGGGYNSPIPEGTLLYASKGGQSVLLAVPSEDGMVELSGHFSVESVLDTVAVYGPSIIPRLKLNPKRSELDGKVSHL